MEARHGCTDITRVLDIQLNYKCFRFLIAMVSNDQYVFIY